MQATGGAGHRRCRPQAVQATGGAGHRRCRPQAVQATGSAGHRRCRPQAVQATNGAGYRRCKPQAEHATRGAPSFVEVSTYLTYITNRIKPFRLYLSIAYDLHVPDIYHDILTCNILPDYLSSNITTYLTYKILPD